MRRLNGTLDAPAFLAALREAPERVLLVDFDGTLAPFRTDRSRVEVFPGVLERLTRIDADGRTRVAIVSGRSLEDLSSRVGPGLELWGSHGLEHRPRHGEIDAPDSAAGYWQLLEECRSWVEGRGWSSVFECKPFGFALHRRANPRVFDEAVSAIVSRWEKPAAEIGLETRPFDGGIELRPRGRGKGEVVRTALAESNPGTPIVYLGDDETDEDAFRALRGRGLAILVRRRPRLTAAEAWLRPPEELMEFLGVFDTPQRAAVATPTR